MFRRGISVVVSLAVLVVTSSQAMAQGGTERYLPAGSQVVLQVDNVQRTQAAYNKTVQGQLWSGDTGKFARAYYKWIKDTAEAAAEQYGIPEKEDVTLIKDLVGVLEKIADEGMAMGIEVKNAFPPEARVVVVLPRVGTGEPNLVKLIRDVRTKAQKFGQKVDVHEEKIGNRTVYSVHADVVHVSWFAADDDFIMTLGTSPAGDYVKALDAGKTGVGNSAIYKRLFDLGAFPTRTRAFVDVPSLAKHVEPFGGDVAKTADEIGLNSFGPILTVSGFDGPAVRTITEIETIGKRKGLAGLMVGNKPITLAELPPMPSDTTTFVAGSVNPGKTFTTAMEVGENVGRIFVPDQVDVFKALAAGVLGGANDLFESFDNFSISYDAPSEGTLKGGATLYKIKDEAKLKTAINNMIAAIPALPGADAGVKKRKYRGVEIYEMPSASFCIYKGYLCYATFPQPVKGYILRVDGVLPKWKMDERLAKAIGAFPKEFTSLTFNDPQKGVESMIAEAPAVVSFLNGITYVVQGVQAFDVSLIPHAQEATMNLFPNVSVTTDDGKKIRIDQRVSYGN